MPTDIILWILSTAGVVIVTISSTLFGLLMARFNRLEIRMDDLDRRERHENRDIRGQLHKIMQVSHDDLGAKIEEFINGFRHLVGIIIDRSIKLNTRQNGREDDH